MTETESEMEVREGDMVLAFFSSTALLFLSTFLTTFLSTHAQERLRKKREEEEAMWSEYIEQRKKQRSKEEEELKKLKERQVSVHSFAYHP